MLCLIEWPGKEGEESSPRGLPLCSDKRQIHLHPPLRLRGDSTTPLSVAGVNAEQRQVANVGDSELWIPTPFSRLRLFFLCIMRLAPAQPKARPVIWVQLPTPQITQQQRGEGAFHAGGVLLPSAVKFHMRNVFWQRHAHVLRLVLWQGNNWAVYWLYYDAEQLHYCVLLTQLLQLHRCEGSCRQTVRSFG